MSIAGCGGGGDSGGAAAGGGTAAANSSVMGLWTITETSKTSSNANCQPPTDPLSTWLAYVSQSGNDLTMMFGVDPTNATFGADGGVFTGTIASGTVSLTGSHPVGTGDGTSTLNPVSATVAASCNSLTGSTSFSFTRTTPSALSCTGTTQFTGTRTVGSGCTGTITNAAVAEVGTAHNTTGTAQSVGVGSVITGSVPASDIILNQPAALANADVYKLTLGATTPVSATLTGAVGQDSDLLMINGSGIVIAASQTLTSNEALSMSLSAGTYYVVVQPFLVTTTTGYTLVIQ